MDTDPESGQSTTSLLPSTRGVTVSWDYREQGEVRLLQVGPKTLKGEILGVTILVEAQRFIPGPDSPPGMHSPDAPSVVWVCSLPEHGKQISSAWKLETCVRNARNTLKDDYNMHVGIFADGGKYDTRGVS